MSISSAIAKFLHRAQTDATATEAELKKVVAAVLPEVTALKDELRDDVAGVGTDVKNALAILDHDHQAAFNGAVSVLETSFKDIFTRLDGLDAKLIGIKADTAAKTATARKATAPAVQPVAVPAAKAAAAPAAAVAPSKGASTK